jgi:hypothetical protein
VLNELSFIARAADAGRHLSVSSIDDAIATVQQIICYTTPETKAAATWEWPRPVSSLPRAGRPRHSSGDATSTSSVVDHVFVADPWATTSTPTSSKVWQPKLKELWHAGELISCGWHSYTPTCSAPTRLAKEKVCAADGNTTSSDHAGPLSSVETAASSTEATSDALLPMGLPLAASPLVGSCREAWADMQIVLDNASEAVANECQLSADVKDAIRRAIQGDRDRS